MLVQLDSMPRTNWYYTDTSTNMIAEDLAEIFVSHYTRCAQWSKVRVNAHLMCTDLAEQQFFFVSFANLQMLIIANHPLSNCN